MKELTHMQVSYDYLLPRAPVVNAHEKLASSRLYPMAISKTNKNILEKTSLFLFLMLETRTSSTIATGTMTRLHGICTQRERDSRDNGTKDDNL